MSKAKKRIIKLPKVSIIIPVYNGEDYVALAIESALNQTYSNLEIIVVNDGSIDNTEEICKKYGDKIKYISKENGGVSTALNLGIKNMTGEYFSWLSHDDLYYENKIEVEVNYLIENNLVGKKVVLYSDYSLIDEYGNLSCDIELNSRYLNRSSSYPMLFGSIDGLSLLIPRRAFDEVGNFDTELRCVQDYQKWYEMFKKGYKFIHIPSVTVCTRIHAKQETNTNPKIIAEGNEYWIKVLSGFSDKEKKELLGSKFNYWFILHSFFDGGPYNDAIELCKNEYSKIIKKNKDEKPKVSIIVNLNSTSSNNKRCLESLIEQTYENIEYIIFVNKEFNNYDILEKLKKENYKVVENNKNNASVWNEGIKLSTGKFITFLEGNASYASDKIEKQVLMMLCSENMMVYSSYNLNNNLVDVGFNNWQIDDLSKETLDINLSTVMLDRNQIVKNKLSFDEKITCGEDIIFIMKILKYGYPLGIRESLVQIDGNKNEEDRIDSVLKYLVKERKIKVLDDEYLNESIYHDKKSVKSRKERLIDLERYRLKSKKDSLLERIKRWLLRS